MSTHSNINVKVGDKYHSVYCHFDGYPSFVGMKLVQHYNSQELAEALVALGTMVSIGDTIETSEYFGRDRNETETEYEVRSTPLEEESYSYVWDGSEWLVSGCEYDEDDNLNEFIGAPVTIVLGLEVADDGNDQHEDESTKVFKYFGCSMDEVIDINNEWAVTYNTDDPRMTDGYNQRQRWALRHRNAPYQGMDDEGIWHHTFFGRTLYEAAERGKEYLQRGKEMEKHMRGMSDEE